MLKQLSDDELCRSW